MKIKSAVKDANYFLTLYFLILLALSTIGAVIGSRFATPLSAAEHVAFAEFCEEIAQHGMTVFYSCLISAVTFPVLAYLVSMLHHGLLLIAILSMIRGFVFGYIFSLFAFLGAKNYTILLIFRETILFSLLFAVSWSGIKRYQIKNSEICFRSGLLRFSIITAISVIFMFLFFPFLLNKL